MKGIRVTELKANLSRYLRQASRGTRFVVMDRDQPLAQLGPLPEAPASWHDRLVDAGRLRAGSQAWRTLRISRLPHRVDIQASLDAVREDPSEVRRR